MHRGTAETPPSPGTLRTMDAEQWDERYRETPALWGGPNRILEPLLAELPPGRAVDLACGDGRHTAWLAERGWRAHGVDFSGAAVAQARSRAAKAVPEPPSAATYEIADVRAWEPTEPVDLVLVAYLHLPAAERSALLGRALSWLTQSGRLVLLAHARENLEHGVGGPQEASILPLVEDLAADVHGARIHRLAHITRSTDMGNAVDVLLDAGRWPD
ncbi:MAG: Thioredoxin reductase [uncultured Nocardioidaceae bacterium]|uniref:Thioredoxin reductase n=1 Tax=uncultured Nocardioidaceae bacterium TaxID=253824 RepID=A0A6J4KWL4_9ACTN|nr:MAG: Thioredoxin reductase [uncultured Nocardioidaceae bacterium]